MAQQGFSRVPTPKRKRRRRRRRRKWPASLDRDVQQFVDVLKEKYPQRIQDRPQAFKRRVLTLVRGKLPPYPRPKGRPPKDHIQVGVRAYQERRRDKHGGRLTRAEWEEIAQAHYPAYRKAKSNWRRESLLRTFQNSVYKAAGRDRRIASHQPM